ncbi:disease resistance protein RPV1-like isoform X2 [Quercus robur]|uniref:disease resistance protein RPV1-like isoform X2 n=1 Tax=Quercus robur TaxID=38942 RepID=UPI00216119CC|nr:disease resistance protein RPV1-like isoform X2 [Quercus robur]
MGRDITLFLSVLAPLLLCALQPWIPQFGLCAATLTHSEGQKNFDRHKYDVFVSFCGKDTRTNFTAHLLDAFDRKGIGAYMDNRDLPRGGEIESEIFNAIEKSRIAVIVFSKNYGTSRWCRDELMKIMECKRRFNQRVIPVFYLVSPSKVSEQMGNFAEAVKLAGWHFEPDGCRLETEFIGEIVETIWKILRGESPISTIPLCCQNRVQNARLRSIHLTSRTCRPTNDCKSCLKYSKRTLYILPC